MAEPKEWIAVRQTKNYQGNQGVTDVNSNDMRCFQMRTGTSTATINAGGTLGFIANSQITHFGPVSFYMARVPDNANINTWEPAGNVWFKVAVIDAVRKGNDWDWPAYSMFHDPFAQFDAKELVLTYSGLDKVTVDFVVPKNVPSGKYLVRVESIALHQAQSVGGAQVSAAILS